MAVCSTWPLKRTRFLAHRRLFVTRGLPAAVYLSALSSCEDSMYRNSRVDNESLYAMCGSGKTSRRGSRMRYCTLASASTFPCMCYLLICVAFPIFFRSPGELACKHALAVPRQRRTWIFVRQLSFHHSSAATFAPMTVSCVGRRVRASRQESICSLDLRFVSPHGGHKRQTWVQLGCLYFFPIGINIDSA